MYNFVVVNCTVLEKLLILTDITMPYRIFIILSLLILTSCELVVIGNPKPPTKIIILDQSSSIGAFYLFKAELDSSNTPAASTILANPTGRTFLPSEHYEMYFDIDRIKRAIHQKEVTNIKTDTLSAVSMRHHVELDYIQFISVTTIEIDSNWYIIAFDEYLEGEKPTPEAD